MSLREAHQLTFIGTGTNEACQVHKGWWVTKVSI